MSYIAEAQAVTAPEGVEHELTYVYVSGVQVTEPTPEALPWGVSKDVDNAWLRYWHFERAAMQEAIKQALPELEGAKLTWKRGASAHHRDGFVMKGVPGTLAYEVTVTPIGDEQVVDLDTLPVMAEHTPEGEVVEAKPKRQRRSRKVEPQPEQNEEQEIADGETYFSE